MYWVIHTRPLRRLLAEQAPPFAAAFLFTRAAIEASLESLRRQAD